MTPAIAAARDRLRSDYDEAFKLLEDKLFADIGEGRCAEEANTDPSRFLAKYFLNPQGQPDRGKTEEAISFSVRGDQEELRGLVEAVPGLEIRVSCVNAVVGWDTTMQRGIETEFKRLESFFAKKEKIHAAQANLDLGTFLKRHLGIDLEGRYTTTGPRPSEPVTINRQLFGHWKLPEEIVAKSSGLLVEEYSRGFVQGIAVVGWDATKIKAEMARLKAEDEREREEEEAKARVREAIVVAELKARWDRRSRPHNELVALSKLNSRPFDIQRLIGSYMVRREGCGDWRSLNDPSEDEDVMKLDIVPSRSSHGLEAPFHFGHIKGTMLLAMSRREVELLREEQPKNDDEYLNSPGPLESGSADQTTRTTEAISTPPVKQEDEDSDQEQQQLLPQSQHRVYFQFVFSHLFRSAEVDFNNENIGYFDFSEARLTAEGIFHTCEQREEEQRVSIFKVSERPVEATGPKSWYMFGNRRSESGDSDSTIYSLGSCYL